MRQTKKIKHCVFSEEWMGEAPCVGKTELFYPNFDDEWPTKSEAREICASCFFQARCLDYALYANDFEGMYGGLDGKERKRLLRKHTATWEELRSSLEPAMYIVAAQHA